MTATRFTSTEVERVLIGSAATAGSASELLEVTGDVVVELVELGLVDELVRAVACLALKAATHLAQVQHDAELADPALTQQRGDQGLVQARLLALVQIDGGA